MATTMLMQNLLVFSSSSSSPPIYRAPARLTRQNSHCVHLASRKTSSSSTSSANNRPLLFLVLLFHASDHVFLFHARPVRESEEGSEEGAVLVPVRGGRRHRPPEHRRLRAPEPGPVSPARRVLRLQARRIPRPPPPGLRDRHLHARRAFTHQDFSGRKGTIRTGDVQWMTAGRGIVHSEMPAADGVQKGLQLWINLASKDKMIEPRYQELESKDISQAEKDGVAVRIIAGEAFGVRSPVYTQTPTMYMDFTMQPGSQLHQPIPEGWNAFVYIIEGEGVFGKEGAAPASAHHCLVLSAGDGLSVWNRSGAPLRFALAAGQPLNEPVVQQGPFVMNSRAQIQQAMEDYYYGRNGFEKASQWSSA
ncbi:unnamed protein product [Triticum turgidum subsp. durum]|uniref:Pirin-like protein n=1 Tax=Triticum turgidum subsp. durum TaxID=4567 RepID=A0A9R0SLE7_TRITD|nr:unnamed protein product [Triticum turgidum subsp. durum]